MSQVNVNKLKPYTYVDQTLKGIQNSKDENHMEETSHEDSENQRELERLGLIKQ